MWTEENLTRAQADAREVAEKVRAVCGPQSVAGEITELYRLARLGLAASKAVIGERPGQPEKMPSVRLLFASAEQADAFLDHPAWKL